MSTTTYVWKAPRPTANGFEVPAGQDLPKMKGRKNLNLAAEIARIDKILEQLSLIPCSFWACEGPTRPRFMLTCTKCWMVRDLMGVRQTLARQLKGD